jgi:hypothetical protein
LTVGPDGNLWFSEQGNFQQQTGALNTSEQIGRITPAGSVSEFPVAPGVTSYGPPVYDVTSPLTVGPDNDLYFTFSTSSYYNKPGTDAPGAITIGRITTSGNIVEFTETVPVPASNPYTGYAPTVGPAYTAYAPTVGSDGNLWFPDATNIGRLDRALATPDQALPPGVLAQSSATYAGTGISSIILNFDAPMNSASASNKSFYSVAAGVKKHHMIVYSKAVKIRSVTYDPTTATVTLKLAKTFFGNQTSYGNQLQVTVHGGIMAANGTSTEGDATTFPI